MKLRRKNVKKLLNISYLPGIPPCYHSDQMDLQNTLNPETDKMIYLGSFFDENSINDIYELKEIKWDYKNYYKIQVFY